MKFGTDQPIMFALKRCLPYRGDPLWEKSLQIFGDRIVSMPPLLLINLSTSICHTGHCKVDQTEKGWFIAYIDRDPETIERQKVRKILKHVIHIIIYWAHFFGMLWQTSQEHHLECTRFSCHRALQLWWTLCGWCADSRHQALQKKQAKETAGDAAHFPTWDLSSTWP